VLLNGGFPIAAERSNYTCMAMHYDVGIIGGGVIGLTCAWRLAQAGARVVLFERGKVGREASWAAGGMLAAQCEMAHYQPAATHDPARKAMFDLCLQSRALYAAFADELFDVTGTDVELSLSTHERGDWRTPGIMYVATDEHDAAVATLLEQRKQNLTVCDAPRLQGYSAVWLPHEGQVNNRLLVKALRVAAERAGVTIRQSNATRVSRLFDTRWNQDRVNISMRLETQCDAVLVCAGAWSADVGNLPPQCKMPVSPVGGEMLGLRVSKDLTKRVIEHVVYSTNAYLIPRRNGLVVVGATMLHRGFRKDVTVGGMSRLLNAACSLVPELEQYSIEESWAGLRPATPDGLPVLGKAPVLENLYMATGHFRNGILLAPITGQLMADCILKGVAPPDAFCLERFAQHTAESEPLCASN
jgi:glycine oxidase